MFYTLSWAYWPVPRAWVVRDGLVPWATPCLDVDVTRQYDAPRRPVSAPLCSLNAGGQWPPCVQTAGALSSVWTPSHDHAHPSSVKHFYRNIDCKTCICKLYGIVCWSRRLIVFVGTISGLYNTKYHEQKKSVKIVISLSSANSDALVFHSILFQALGPQEADKTQKDTKTNTHRHTQTVIAYKWITKTAK